MQISNTFTAAIFALALIPSTAVANPMFGRSSRNRTPQLSKYHPQDGLCRDSTLSQTNDCIVKVFNDQATRFNGELDQFYISRGTTARYILAQNLLSFTLIQGCQPTITGELPDNYALLISSRSHTSNFAYKRGYKPLRTDPGWYPSRPVGTHSKLHGGPPEQFVRQQPTASLRAHLSSPELHN
ncbi:hypothetical protein PpBr36_09082 [Pyricularia pennisetigena]|uniref:hypothetical protein n=1 Tax=Pyricularia pennisetigena TaxID=1578925 RepID=UPI00114E1DD7|nr:hypothetical protein PpBr36_09082 [Pyricularia pennisetigena]TLS24516.1 hypothetical protein PpBr36_09082 [Pyricularia pennisetigena]